MHSNVRAVRRRAFRSRWHKDKKNDEHKLDVEEEYFDEWGLESVSDDENYFLRIIFNGLKQCVCYVRR